MDLLVVQTGGTIDKDYPRNHLGYAFEICEPAAKKILERITLSSCKVTFTSVCRKDSQDITDDDRNLLADMVKEANQDKILITHGTDTMIETAQYLSNLPEISATKTIIFTGAFKPETFKNSDAEFNIGIAIGGLQCLSKPGVHIAMNGLISHCDNVVRDIDRGQFMRK